MDTLAIAHITRSPFIYQIRSDWNEVRFEKVAQLAKEVALFLGKVECLRQVGTFWDLE